MDDTPAWLKKQIAEFEALPAPQAPLAVWRLTHKGAPAYFLIAACCDQYNPLYDADGKLLCHPTGGIVGRGDGRCPHPADKGTPVTLVWLHPKSPLKHLDPPDLAAP